MPDKTYPTRADLLWLQGPVYQAQGRPELAGKALNDAVSAYCSLYRGPHASIGEVMVTRALLLDRQGRAADAVAQCDSGIRMRNETVGDDQLPGLRSVAALCQRRPGRRRQKRRSVGHGFVRCHQAIVDRTHQGALGDPRIRFRPFLDNFVQFAGEGSECKIYAFSWDRTDVTADLLNAISLGGTSTISYCNTSSSSSLRRPPAFRRAQS